MHPCCGTCLCSKKQTKQTDADVPLHLMQPEYPIPYGIPDQKEIKNDLDKILGYLETTTPAQIVDAKTEKAIIDTSEFDQNTALKKGDFRITSYESGVTYAAMLSAAEITNDKRYEKYVYDRFNFFADVFPVFKKLFNDYGLIDPQMHQMVKPKALDDAGAMCAAMIKAQRKDQNLNLRPIIDNYKNYIMYGEYRLFDGTFARKRPQMNTVWLDDMFMSIPALEQMGALTGDNNISMKLQSRYSFLLPECLSRTKIYFDMDGLNPLRNILHFSGEEQMAWHY
jgi:hypothetical protein